MIYYKFLEGRLMKTGSKKNYSKDSTVGGWVTERDLHRLWVSAREKQKITGEFDV